MRALQELLAVDDMRGSLDITEYQCALAELRNANENGATKQWKKAIFFGIVGLVALYLDATLIAVALLLIAADYHKAAANHQLMTGILTTHRLLAMFINKQTRDLEAISKVRDPER